MSLRRVRAVQAHPVPEVAYTATGPDFDLDANVTIVRDYETEEFPPGATVLNGMKGVPLYVCEVCGQDVAEAEFDGHLC